MIEYTFEIDGKSLRQRDTKTPVIAYTGEAALKIAQWYANEEKKEVTIISPKGDIVVVKPSN